MFFKLQSTTVPFGYIVVTFGTSSKRSYVVLDVVNIFILGYVKSLPTVPLQLTHNLLVKTITRFILGYIKPILKSSFI